MTIYNIWVPVGSGFRVGTQKVGSSGFRVPGRNPKGGFQWVPGRNPKGGFQWVPGSDQIFFVPTPGQAFFRLRLKLRLL